MADRFRYVGEDERVLIGARCSHTAGELAAVRERRGPRALKVNPGGRVQPVACDAAAFYSQALVNKRALRLPGELPPPPR